MAEKLTDQTDPEPDSRFQICLTFPSKKSFFFHFWLKHTRNRPNCKEILQLVMVKVKNSDEKLSASSLWALGASCRVIRRSIVLARLKRPKRPLRHRRHTKLHVDRGKRGTRNRPPSWISSSTSCMHHQLYVPQITGTKCLSKSSAISTFWCIYFWLFWHFPMLYPAGRWCLTTRYSGPVRQQFCSTLYSLMMRWYICMNHLSISLTYRHAKL